MGNYELGIMNYEWEGRLNQFYVLDELKPYGSGKKENIILEKTFAFAVRIVKLQQFLVKEKTEFVLSKQILRSGTSVGANTEEAMAASSTRDFIAKLDIAAKEIRETSYFLRLLFHTGYISPESFESIHGDCLEIKKILSSILLTTKANQNRIMKTHNS